MSGLDVMTQVLALGQVVPAGFAEVGLVHYLVLGSAMFGMGVVGFLARRNLIIMFLCTELMFQGVALCLVGFGQYHGNRTGEVFVIFVLTIAAAEAALALALVVLLFRRGETLDADAWRELEG
ncbi:MAG: NADH-quinone oxidoreductase subunit NuoK [Planctomycetota bacterium]